MAIVALNHNGKELLLQCLQCMETVDYRPLSTVMVDNGSTDGSAEEARRRYPGIHLVSVGYNAGVFGGGTPASVMWKNICKPNTSFSWTTTRR